MAKSPAQRSSVIWDPHLPAHLACLTTPGPSAVISSMAGLKIPELNGGFIRKITDKWSIFQHAMFDYRKVIFNVLQARLVD